MEDQLELPSERHADDLVTKGHGVQQEETWFAKFGDWLDDFFKREIPITKVNGAAPGRSPFVTSLYQAYCVTISFG
jgi:hypothetical protein